MNKRIGVLLVVLACALALAPGLRAQQQEPRSDRLREMMVGDYETLMKVMFQLSERKYAEAAKEVEAIQRHADSLAAPGAKRDTLFYSYARSLSAHAENLRALALALADGDVDLPPVRRPQLEFMHDIIAADFGEIAATCVACHGHFLPKP